MILGFKDQFVPYVLDGTKTHTIRAGARWRADMRADLFAKVRQKGMRLLFRAPVVRVESIAILCDPGRRVDGWPSADLSPLRDQTMILIAGVGLDESERQAFAWRDGFRIEGYRGGYFEQMVEFWRKEHGLGRRVVNFHGQIIHWDYAARYIPCADCGRSHPLGPCNAQFRSDWRLPRPTRAEMAAR